MLASLACCSQASALSMALSFSSFMACIFFLMASIVMEGQGASSQNYIKYSALKADFVSLCWINLECEFLEQWMVWVKSLRPGLGRVSHIQVRKIFPQNTIFFNLFSFGSKKDLIRFGQKFPGQSQVDTLFTAVRSMPELGQIRAHLYSKNKYVLKNCHIQTQK